MTIQLTGAMRNPDRAEVGEGCPMHRASNVLARRSTLLLLREAAYGTTRFDDFVRRTGLTESVTAAQLKAMVLEGLLTTASYQEPGQRRRSEYVLTPAGEELVPVLLAFAAWGERHRPHALHFQMTHEGCGAELDVELRCRHGHQVDTSDVVVALERAAE
jgi:DNA-binding HxlR family transcriptional regulator